MTKTKSTHPVLLQEYAIYTPPMDEMIKTIGNWIDQRLTGGYIYGPSRFGKSRTVKWYIRSVLTERFGRQLPMVVWVRAPGMKTEREFWNLLLDASGFEFYSPSNPKKKIEARFLFKQRLITMARSARENYVVLIIDEAQDISLNEYRWILGMQNELDYEGFRLSLFSIGSHSVDYVPNYLARIGDAHIAARFFSVDARFNGIRGKEALEYVLNGYDIDSEWPKGTGASYLQYFAPDDFSRGRRLAHCVNEIWQAFITLLPPEHQPEQGAKKNKPDFQIPMHHVAHTVEQALRQLANGEEWEDVISRSGWLNKIANTGFTDYYRLISAPS